MEYLMKDFNSLSGSEVYEILKVRSAIFVVEQDVVYQDIDDIDYKSLHCIIREGNKVLAYMRVYQDDEGYTHLGRVLTLNHGDGLGRKMMEHFLPMAKKAMPAPQIIIHAQCYARGYYEKFGFEKSSEEFLEDGIPHIEMRLNMTESKA